MDFPVHEFHDGNVVVIDIPERLTLENADKLKFLLKDLVDRQMFQIIINLESTRYMDSSGLGAIVSKISKTRANQGDIRLSSLHDYTKNLVELTHINKVIRIFDTVEDAVKSFKE